MGFKDIEQFLKGLSGAGMHAKRILSLANATPGVVRTGSLAVHAIGQGLAAARGLKTRRAVKQVDRLLSNPGIGLGAVLPHWVRHVVANRAEIRVALDWTGFDAGGQPTIMLSLTTVHGCATPLVWLTVDTATLKSNGNEYEYRVLVRHAGMLPAGTKACIVAGRGFGDQKLYRRLWLLNALAVMLPNVFGAVGEALGYDRMLRSNTAKRRTRSLFRQGFMLYELLPNMPEARLLPLVKTFAAMLTEVPAFAETFGIASI